MRPWRTGPVVAGMLVLALVMSVSAMQKTRRVHVPRPVEDPLLVLPTEGPASGAGHVIGIPDPRRAVRLEDRVPFRVPPRMLLVITAIGGHSATRLPAEIELVVDGAVLLTRSGPHTTAFARPGVVVRPGSEVVVEGTDLTGYCLGYLEPREPEPGSMTIHGIPDPRAAVLIMGGEPYAVPAGHSLVVTGFSEQLFADGVLYADTEVNGWTLPPELPPPGLLLAGVTAVEVVVSPGSVGAIGYLITNQEEQE